MMHGQKNIKENFLYIAFYSYISFYVPQPDAQYSTHISLSYVNLDAE